MSVIAKNWRTPCRTYRWIVKGGEDVRTDERMEMILDVCNGLLNRHPGAASHRLKVGRAGLSVDWGTITPN